MTELLVNINTDREYTLFTYYEVTRTSKNGYLWKGAHEVCQIIEYTDGEIRTVEKLHRPLRKNDTISFRHQYMQTNTDGSSFHMYKHVDAYRSITVEEFDSITKFRFIHSLVIQMMREDRLEDIARLLHEHAEYTKSLALSKRSGAE